MHTVNDEQVLTLRERKARETQRAIEEATLDLAIECGLPNVTTEQIAERADISPRTFFNYFASKEDAVVGYSLRNVSDGLLRSYPQKPSAHGTYADLREFLISEFGNWMMSDVLLAKRMEVATENPALLRSMRARTESLLSELTHKVALSLAQEAGEESSAHHQAEANMLVHIAGTVVGHTIDQWRRAPGTHDPIPDLSFAFTLFERTVAAHIKPPKRT